LPLPVTLKRFLAPLCVFILGIARSLPLAGSGPRGWQRSDRANDGPGPEVSVAAITDR
jgi:hypothetical protein